MTFTKNHYQLLGVPSTADGEALHKAFRKLSKELHPDTTDLPQDEAAQRFHQVCEAYELLADPILRRSYDLQLLSKELKEKKIKSKSESFSRNYFQQKNLIGDRRPLSGGELFSLLLLGGALVISLFFAIIFGVVQGRELMIRPTWLTIFNSEARVMSVKFTDGSITSNQNSSKSAFFRRY